MSKPPLYEHYDETTQSATEVTKDEDTGRLVFVHSQNTRAIVESAKQLASNFDKHIARKQSWTLVARVPRVMWNQWQKLGVTKDQKLLNQLLDSRECRLLRTDDGRKL